MLSIVGLVAGRVVAKLGARNLIAAGMALIAVAQVAMTRFAIDTTWQWMIAPLMIVGTGQGLAYTVSTTAGMKSAPEEKSGAASGILNMTKLVGCVVGIAVTQAVFEQLQPHRLSSLLRDGVARADAVPQAFMYAFTRSMAVLAVVALAGVVVSLLLIRDATAPVDQPLLQPSAGTSGD